MESFGKLTRSSFSFFFVIDELSSVAIYLLN